jgi:RHS repeat-associated protein
VNVPKLLQTRRYFGDGVIMIDSAWTMARFAGGYFTPSGILTPTIKTAAVGTNLTTATLYSSGAHYYVRDYQGNNVAVIDSVGTAVQTTNYYPYGTPWSNINSHPFLYSDKEWQTTYGANRYSHGARYYVPSLFNFSTPDPLAEKHPDVSTYIYCVGNPIMNIDPLGCDTVNITYNNSVWEIAGTILANGDDVFNVSANGETREITFNDNVEYGKRVNCLNLTIGKNKNDLTLGVYRVSGAVENGTGFYVTPGGAASNKKGSNARILDGTYPIEKPQSGAYWPKPGLGGSVENRGIRFHYGGGSGASLAQWTDGCFVLFPNYSIQNGAYEVDVGKSKDASNAFDDLMGAEGRVKKKELGTKLIHHDGSYFPNKITYSLILKTL